MNWKKTILSIPKSVWINFRYLPIRQAIKFPIAASHSCRISGGGKIILSANVVSFAMIRVGFHNVLSCNCKDETKIVIAKCGVLEFKGSAHIGNGAKLYVSENAVLSIGENFAISASSSINCYKEIRFGKDIQFSWNCLVMDSDTHFIFDDNGNQVNEDKPILFDDKIWIGCNCTILKGTVIPYGCVIGANSLVSGSLFKSNTVIAGSPAKSVKNIGS